MYFTHKHIALILLSALIVGGAFVLAEYRNIQKQKIVYNAPISAVVDQISSELQELDSDNDALKDWEEVLLGTDPHKTDSDGDGSSDGKEATAGRNPLVKGPNDKPADIAKSSAPEEELTATDKVARDFFARYMQLNQAGLTADAQSQAELVEEVIKNGVVLSKPKAYTAVNILVSADSGKEAVRRYGNEVGALFAKHSNPNFRSEVLIAKESLEQDNPELLKEIDPILEMYKNILNGLLKISAPESLSANHLTLVNSISVLLFCAENLRKVDNDTLAGIQGTSMWLSGAEGLNRSFNTLKSSFGSNGIAFTSGEGGYFFQPK